MRLGNFTWGNGVGGEDPKLGYLLCQLEWLWVSGESCWNWDKAMGGSKDVWIDLWDLLEKRGGNLQWVTCYRSAVL